jgi:hypothetical protein
MAIKRVLFFIIIALIPIVHASAQTDSFCTPLHAIIADAPNKFILTKGATSDVGESSIKWDCNIPLGGVISARVVSAMGLFYEGALCQTQSLDEVKATYDKYKTKISACLVGDGYKLSVVDNFNKGAEQFKKLIYMLPPEDSQQALPPHVSLEVNYDNPTGVYTVIIYVWEK